jgi:hypothetical protein
MDEEQSKSTQLDFFKILLSDNKALAKEAKVHLSIVENLEKENKSLSNDLRNFQREAELCKQREELSTRRNAALVRENRLLKQNFEQIVIEKKRMQEHLEGKVSEMKAMHATKLEDAGWANERLEIDLVVKETKLKQVEKNCKHLLEKNRQIRKLVRQSTTDVN